jgi:hypothetical protein
MIGWRAEYQNCLRSIKEFVPVQNQKEAGVHVFLNLNLLG